MAYSNRSNMERSHRVSRHCSFPKARVKKQKEIAHQLYFHCRSIHAPLPNGSLTGGWAHKSPENTAGNQLASAPLPRVRSLHRQQVETRTKLKRSGILWLCGLAWWHRQGTSGAPPGLPPPSQSGEAGWGLLAAIQPWEDTSPTWSGAARTSLLQNLEPVGYFYMVFSDLWHKLCFLGQLEMGEWQEHLQQLLHINFFLKKWRSACVFFALLPFALSSTTVYLISAETKLFHLSLLDVWGSSLVELIRVFDDFCDAIRSRGFFFFPLISQESVEWVHRVQPCVVAQENSCTTNYLSLMVAGRVSVEQIWISKALITHRR